VINHPQIAADQPAPRVFGVGPVDRATAMLTQSSLATFLDESGEFPIAATSVLFDHALGARIASFLAPDDRMVTSHMHLEVLRLPPAGIAHVAGRNIDTTMAPGSAFCIADAVGPDGDVLVRATGRFSIISGGRAAGGRVESDAAPTRPSIDDLADGRDAERGSPAQQLFGLHVVESSDAEVRTRALARTEFANERGGIHGGVGAFMCERAADVALCSRLGGRHEYRPVEMRIYFARPLPADGGTLDLVTTIGFLGRTTASTTTRLLRRDGKLAVQVDVTHLVRPE
jgi:acyl-coenzyme A thioesterase PaaI-like protein